MSEVKTAGESTSPASDSAEMRQAADEVEALAKKYGFTTRTALKRVAMALHDEARRLEAEER